MAIDVGPMRRYKIGDVLWAENDWVTMAYVVSNDPKKVGTVGLHGPDELCVIFIGPKEAGLWDIPALGQAT